MVSKNKSAPSDDAWHSFPQQMVKLDVFVDDDIEVLEPTQGSGFRQTAVLEAQIMRFLPTYGMTTGAVRNELGLPTYSRYVREALEALSRDGRVIKRRNGWQFKWSLE